MKTIAKISALITVTAMLLTVSCRKNSFPPPDPFASLSNQLICKINGAEWKSTQRGGGFFFSPTTGREYIRIGYANGWDEITIYINAPYDKSFYIFNKTTQTYPSANYPDDYLAFFKGYPDLTPSEEYVTNIIDTGKVEIVFMDRNNHKIKGKFFFTGKDSRTGLKKVVTEGYLDYYR